MEYILCIQDALEPVHWKPDCDAAKGGTLHRGGGH